MEKKSVLYFLTFLKGKMLMRGSVMDEVYGEQTLKCLGRIGAAVACLMKKYLKEYLEKRNYRPYCYKP